MNRIIKLFICFIALFQMSFVMASQSSGAGVTQAAGAGHKRVLILYAYNNNVPTLQQIAAGISSCNELQTSDIKTANIAIS